VYIISLNIYFIDSDEYLHSYVFAQFYILSAVRHHASGNDFFLPNICTAFYTRVLYLFSYFTFPCASAASNHKSQANPRVFVVYALSHKEHRFPPSRLISPLHYVFPYVRAVVFLRRLFFHTVSRELSERKRAYPFTIPNWYRETYYFCNLSFSALFARYVLRLFRFGVFVIIGDGT